MNVIQCCYTYALPLEGIVHVGANKASEYPTYARYIKGLILFVEAIPHHVKEIDGMLDQTKPHFVRQAVVGEEAGKAVRFNISGGDGRASSYLDLGRLKEISPSIKYVESFEAKTERLDDIIEKDYAAQDFNVAVIDAQGSDLDVLKGCERIFDRIDAFYVEVTPEAIYEGGCTFLDIYKFLDACGYLIRDVELSPHGWGNAFFVRRETRLHKYSAQSLARGKPATQSSTYAGYTASRGVDNVLTGPVNVHTHPKDNNAWWQVDLGEVCDINRLMFVDRSGVEARARSLLIQVSNDGQTYRDIFNRAGRGLTTLIDLKWKGRGRYVKLSLAEPGPLHFRQVIVI
jgi:FkbM family methyltransferase